MNLTSPDELKSPSTPQETPETKANNWITVFQRKIDHLMQHLPRDQTQRTIVALLINELAKDAIVPLYSAHMWTTDRRLKSKDSPVDPSDLIKQFSLIFKQAIELVIPHLTDNDQEAVKRAFEPTTALIQKSQTQPNNLHTICDRIIDSLESIYKTPPVDITPKNYQHAINSLPKDLRFKSG